MGAGFSDRRSQTVTMEQIADFLDGRLFRENFTITFTKEFQERNGRGEEYVVWVEGFDPSAETLQFFYDDGDELDDEYPDIICRPEDITSIREI